MRQRLTVIVNVQKLVRHWSVWYRAHKQEAGMARGREKDRRVRKKHRKKVERMKRLAKARRTAAAKAKKR